VTEGCADPAARSAAPDAETRVNQERDLIPDQDDGPRDLREGWAPPPLAGPADGRACSAQDSGEKAARGDQDPAAESRSQEMLLAECGANSKSVSRGAEDSIPRTTGLGGPIPMTLK
jgi:hypothetical protein